MERVVMGWAASAGVPVPDVVAIVPGDVDVMVATFVEGVPLASMPTAASDALAWRCGEVLATIHGVSVEGFGNLGPDGRGPSDDFAAWFGVDAVGDGGDVGAPVLVHGDFSPANVLVRGDEVVAVLDWESAKGGPPALDFGWWDWITTTGGQPRPFAADAMFEGYESVRPLDRALVAALGPSIHERINRSVRAARPSTGSPSS
jgi:aminoglycoside phosphotransferase (APT) family kinase protein